MHIVLVNRWYPPYTGFGGVAVYNHYLGHALAKLGHQVTILAGRWSENDPAHHTDGPINVHRVFAPEWGRLKRLPFVGAYIRPLQQYLYSQALSRALDELHKTNPIDVVEFAEVNAEGYVYVQRSKRCLVVVRCHTPTFILKRYYTSDEMNFDTTWTSRMEATCIRLADGLTAPSLDMVKTVAEYMAFPETRLMVIPNALDPSAFVPVEPKQHQPGPVTILHVGRLERVKGIQTLAEAFRLVKEQVPDARLVFVGDDRPDGSGGTWGTRLSDYFSEHGLADSVAFIGGVSQQTLIDWYHRSDIAVVPSMLYESFSYTCAQAMAAGLPLVSTQIGGIPETLGDCGLIVPPGQPGPLAEALICLANEPALRQSLGECATRRVWQFCASSKTASQTAAYYLQLQSRKNASS